MKKLAFVLLAAISAVAMAFTGGPEDKELEELKIGAPAPLTNMKMKDISGKLESLQTLKKEGGLLVVFSCNTCPFVIGWEDRYNDIHALATNNNIGMVLVNSNEAKRGGDDSLDKMKVHASEQKYTMPYVVDEKHTLADAFGARTTPHVYLFDKDMKLVYKGAIDDNMKDKNSVKEEYLNDALKQLATGKKIKVNESKALGCSIKRVKA